MKLLLTAINAKYIHSNLAVYSLRAYAASQGCKVALAEYTINQPVEYILEQLYRSKPDVLCFSCYIWNIEYVKELAGEFHRLCPDVPIWVGGPEVSYETAAFLRENEGIAGILIGEGEATFLELCRYYEATQEKREARYMDRTEVRKNEDSLRDIPGIMYRDTQGEIHRTEQRQLLDMDQIPFCYEQVEDFANRIIYYESSRGCPYSCSYCLSSVDKRLRFRSLDLVLRELQFFIDRKVPQVKFVDRTFNCSHTHAMAIWRYLAEHDNGVTNFHFEISADLLNEEELDLMQTLRPGLVQFEIGVQTVNAETIREIRRTMDLQRLEEKVARIRAGGNIHQHLDLIAGLPYEDLKGFAHSFDVVYAMKPQQLQLGFLKVLKGAYIYEKAEEYGLLYRRKPPYEVLATRWLSHGDVLELKQVEEVLELHYNSGQFPTSLRLLEEVFDSAYELYRQLGDFYQQQGYRGQTYSRMARSEIFLAFALRVDSEREHLYRQALTYDLYCRENVKRRPDWSQMGEADHKQQLRYLRSVDMDRRYCHLEAFDAAFLSWRYQSPMEAGWLLFDYEERHPMTGDAQIQYVGDIYA